MCGYLRLITDQSALPKNVECVATAEPGLLLSRKSGTWAIWESEFFIHVNQK